MSTPSHAKKVEARFLTREELRQQLNDRGYVISAGYFNQLCLPSRGKGPPVARWWGSRPLYELGAGLAWAEDRCKTPSTEP